MSINQKVQQLTANKITLRDILTRKKFWKKPNQENYRDLILYIGWKHWTREYNYLPIPDKFIEIQNKTCSELKEKPKESYYITRNRNGVLTIALQNPKSLDLLRPDMVLFFGNNTENIKPFLYWITSVDYSNNETLYCLITAERCPVWAYYGNFMNGRGKARITESQLGGEHNGHLDSDNDCLACEWCYDFCGDLRVKKAKKGSELIGNSSERDLEVSWQPKFGIVYIDPCDMALAPNGFRLKDADITLARELYCLKWIHLICSF